MKIGISGIHHVQFTVRPEDEAACKAFYGGVLGLEEFPKPEPLRDRGGAFFRCGNIEVHLSLEDEPDNGGSRRHLCFEVDDLGVAEAALREAGAEIIPDRQPIEEWVRFYVRDPGGNRVEFAQAR
jgi:catechol 2,3-dioxygenase-like lactoylglutathione lyase family enzyme